jgi:hypothetical protein
MTHDTSDLKPGDFRSSFPAGAAHAASEVDDYDGAAPEGAAFAVLLIAAAIAIVGIAAWAVFR